MDTTVETISDTTIAEANSKLTRLVTRTKGVEINSSLKLAELGL